MSAFASTSRSVLARAAPLVAPAQSTARHATPCRSFASSATARNGTVVTLRIAIARTTTTFAVPSLATLLDKLLLPAQEAAPMPALAGGASGTMDGEADASVQDVLEWDGMLNAVPKSRVSHSRKRMRSANKGLKDRVDLVHCQGCGRPRVAHHICGHCYSVIAREQKETKRRSAAAVAPEKPQGGISA